MVTIQISFHSFSFFQPPITLKITDQDPSKITDLTDTDMDITTDIITMATDNIRIVLKDRTRNIPIRNIPIHNTLARNLQTRVLLTLMINT